MEQGECRDAFGVSFYGTYLRCRHTGPVLTALRIRAALCQIFDSIFMDIPMSRVKFNVNTEYAYIQNFKVLQSTKPPH